MNPDKKSVHDEDQWISQGEAARILNISARHAGYCIRKGYLKDKVSYRSHNGRHFRYSLKDLKKVLEAATVPARKSVGG